MVTNTRKFKQQAKQQRAGVKGGGRAEWRKREEEEVGKKRKRWRTWAGEMSAPQGGRPVLSTANRRGKHLQDKQSAHYLGEHWHCRQQDTSLQKHHCSYTWEASFQNARATFGSKMLLQDSNRIPIKLTRKYLKFYDHSFIFTFIVSNLFFFILLLFIIGDPLFWKETLCDIYQDSKKAIITGAGYQMLCYQDQNDMIFSISYLKKYKYV